VAFRKSGVAGKASLEELAFDGPFAFTRSEAASAPP
jgi:hypothetical protein